MIVDKRIRVHTRLQRDAQPRTNRDAQGDGEALVLPGVLATQTEVVHFLWDIFDYARIILDINDAVVRAWDFESLPFLKDHRTAVDFVIGRIRELRTQEGELWADFHFDPVLGEKYYGAAERGTLEDLSIGAELLELALVEPGNDEQYPLYRATKWRPVEGSLVWSGADANAGFRRTSMNGKVRRMLRDRGLSDADIDAIERDIAEDGGGQPADVTGVARVADTPASPPAPTPNPPAGTNPSTQPVPDVQSEAYFANLARHLAPHLKSLPAAAPTPTPAPTPAPAQEAPIDIAVRGARDLKVPENVIAEARAAAGNDAEKFGLACRAYLAAHQSVPKVVPRGIEGGHERKFEALADMGACLRARCGVANDADQKRINQHQLEPQRTSMLGLATRAVQAWGSGQELINDPAVMLEEFTRETVQRALPTRLPMQSMPGMRFVQRDSWGGLVPGDLPAVFADVMHKVLMESYDRATLPFDKLARRRDVADRRVHHMVHTDIAGQFEPLAVSENLKPITVREQSTEFVVHPYGHYHKVEWASFIDDDLGFLQQLPQQLGNWHGSQKTRKFTEAIIAGKMRNGQQIYAASYDRQVQAITEFRAILAAIRDVALAATPIPAEEQEDPGNDAGKSYALLPTVMLYPHGIRLDWESFAAPQQVDNRSDMRVTYERDLWQNSYEGLYLPQNHWYTWPGPGSPFCPFVYGEITGQGMTLRVGPTSATEQDGMYMRVTSTFGAAPVREKTAFRVRPSA